MQDCDRGRVRLDFYRVLVWHPVPNLEFFATFKSPPPKPRPIGAMNDMTLRSCRR